MITTWCHNDMMSSLRLFQVPAAQGQQPTSTLSALTSADLRQKDRVYPGLQKDFCCLGNGAVCPIYSSTVTAVLRARIAPDTGHMHSSEHKAGA